MATAISTRSVFTTELDTLLFEVCEELQITPDRHRQATERYVAVAAHFEAPNSPFSKYSPRIYPQGSMALGTTVKPVTGPHDLDFVLELSIASHLVDPMKLIDAVYRYLRQSGRYAAMTSLLKRCVRIEYANEFYMDILPACRDLAAGGTCIEVPDRKLLAFTKSNPLGFIRWFRDQRSRVMLMDKVAAAAPVPALQSVDEKQPLQLVVQLIKRWRDIYYENAELAPISIVLTTLAANHYRGEASVSDAMTTVLAGIVSEIADAESRGQRVKVVNPLNKEEDFSERWDGNRPAYFAFTEGLRRFFAQWQAMLDRGGNIGPALEKMFGEPVRAVYTKRAKLIRERREKGELAVTPSGLIVPATTAATIVKPHTFYGEE